MQRVNAIAALAKGSHAIGKDNKLLWHLPPDMKHFKEVTTPHIVIMGRKTWESIDEKYRPLSDRVNIVITRNEGYEAPGAIVVHSLEEAVWEARKYPEKEIFIGGGQQIYEQALPLTDRLYLTLVDADPEADTFFPEYEHVFTRVVSEEAGEHKGVNYTWLTLER